ncbi:MAG TPA: hypothetical protein VFL83_21665 [Anaeromyxobacter sp.]|nr:hypothetical protein [Anaeromyxobacter sp.]
MPAVWEGRFAEYLKRVFGLREGTSNQLLPDLMPTAPTLDAAACELLRARDELLAHGTVDVAAGGAGNRSEAWFWNDTPGTLLAFDRIAVSVVTAGRVYLCLTSGIAPPAANSLMAPADSRWGLRLVGKCGSTTRGGAIISAPLTAAFDLPAAQSVILQWPVVLSNGWRLVVVASTANVGLLATALVRERTAPTEAPA